MGAAVELDIDNPRPYLLQGLFDSDSDSLYDEEEQGQAASLRLERPAPEKGQQHFVGGGLRTDDVSHTKNTSAASDTDLEEYEMASRAKAASVPNDGDKGASSGEEGKVDVSSPPPSALQSERSIQDSLSGELLRMAGVLKANSMAFADALERDRKLLEEAGEKLQGNLTLMTRTRGKLGEYSRKARGMGWLTLASVAVVCFSWVIMFLLIKLT